MEIIIGLRLNDCRTEEINTHKTQDQCLIQTLTFNYYYTGKHQLTSSRCNSIKHECTAFLYYAGAKDKLN